VLGAVFALLSLAFVSQAASAPVTVSHVESSGLAFNQCSDELMDVTAMITTVNRSFTTPTGALHTLSHATSTGEAVGLVSGDQYRGQFAQSSTEVDFPPLADGDFTRTMTTTLQYIGHGSVVNLRLHTVFHMTFHDGEVVVAIDNISFTCN